MSGDYHPVTFLPEMTSLLLQIQTGRNRLYQSWILRFWTQGVLHIASRNHGKGKQLDSRKEMCGRPILTQTCKKRYSLPAVTNFTSNALPELFPYSDRFRLLPSRYFENPRIILVIITSQQDTWPTIEIRIWCSPLRPHWRRGSSGLRSNE